MVKSTKFIKNSSRDLERLILIEEKHDQYPTELEFGNIQLKFATILIHSTTKIRWFQDLYTLVWHYEKIHFHINYEYTKVVSSIGVCLCVLDKTKRSTHPKINLVRSYYKEVSCVVFVPKDLQLDWLFHYFHEISVMLQGRLYAKGRGISHSTLPLYLQKDNIPLFKNKNDNWRSTSTV